MVTEERTAGSQPGVLPVKAIHQMVIDKSEQHLVIGHRFSPLPVVVSHIQLVSSASTATSVCNILHVCYLSVKREAKTPDLVEEMQTIVDDMVENREIRLEQKFLRLTDPRADDDPDDVWMVLRGVLAPNAYIGFVPVTNAEYAVFTVPSFSSKELFDLWKKNRKL